ncbi:broad-complex core protein-like [Anopheles nili]|uniref:broad-complex core protein-like n=1 Tax=Anopheles nili TaxID=185578 RepID=UPI00237A84CA|nr:broad-complex core protein-like [Anopheles nili]
MSTAGLSQQFCVRWNSHLGSLGAAFPQLLAGQRFVDVTLACEGHQVHCHRLVLAACSTYFENLLGENPCQHPIIILPRDIKLWAIQALVDFMYKGEVNVSQAGLPDLMKCAEVLKIRGLCGSDAALNLNQIHSPLEGGSGNYQQHQQQHTASSSDGTDNGGHSKTSDGSLPRQGGNQFQNQHEQHSKSQKTNTSSGPKGQLLGSLHLQPTEARNHHQDDDANHSDNGESGNEMCIKTEDLMIDEDTSSRPCGDDEDATMDGNEHLSSDGIRCEQFLGVHAMDAEEQVHARVGRDSLQDRVVEEEEIEEREKMMVSDGSGMVDKSDELQTVDQHHHDRVQGDYDNYAIGNESDYEEDYDLMEVRDETKDPGLAAQTEARNSKGMRRKIKKLTLSHNELAAIGPTTVAGGTNARKNGNRNATDGSRANGTWPIGAVPSLSSITAVRSTPGGSRGSIRVKSIENLFENYQAKQSPKSSREKRKLAQQSSVLMLDCSGANNSEIDSASEHTASGISSSMVYNRNKLEVYAKQPQVLADRPDRRSANAGSDGCDETNASTNATDGDGYENIICSPNFPQLTEVVGTYKAEEEDDEEEDYGDEYAIKLMAEEIDSSMIANGGDSEGDEILYKPPPLMAIGGPKGSEGNAKSSMLRTYGRAGGGMSAGNGASSTLTIRKIDVRGNMSASQANSLGRTGRRPRLLGRSKDPLHQLINSNGTAPPIAFTLRNPRGNQPRTYTTEALWAALMDVKAGESIYRASQMHKVPRKTLRNWMKRWDIKSAYPMPRQLKEAAEKKRIIKELTSQIQ